MPIDLITTAVTNLGIGGATVAAMLWIAMRMIPRMQQQREEDLAWARSALERSQSQFLAALDRIEERWEGAVREIAGEVRALRDEVRALRCSEE